MSDKSKYFKDDTISLRKIIELFNSPIKEEHAWALCYQCANYFADILRIHKDRKKCFNVTKTEHVWLTRDGSVHSSTIFGNDHDRDNDSKTTRVPFTNEHEIVVGLGLVIYDALNAGYDYGEERSIGKDLEHLIDQMTSFNEQAKDESCHETEDDEGIERDSSEYGDVDHPVTETVTSQQLQLQVQGQVEPQPQLQLQPSQHSMLLNDVILYCSRYISPSKQQQQIIDDYYKAVCRALVAEAIELITFLEKVSSNRTDDLIKDASDLSILKFTDWARFWVQVMSELRMGVKLKKIDHSDSRTPIEYKLTPYEILMDDIRSRRYQLKKIMIDNDIPQQMKKDAHAVILEFIRSRPPLKKVADRKLPPPKKLELTPREQLMVSIKKGRQLRPVLNKTKREIVISNRTNDENITPLKSCETSSMKENNIPSHRPIRRRIKVCEQKNSDDDDDDWCHSTYDRQTKPIFKQLLNSNSDNRQRIKDYRTQSIEPYDLATDSSNQKHSIKKYGDKKCGNYFLPRSRPSSRQSNDSLDELEVVAQSQTAVTPDLSWSRTSSQEDILKSKNWEEAMSLEDRLSLTLDEIVHIRSVLTKAELEALPVDANIKNDVENRKICFLCLKTRFGLFGSWGQKCRLCHRTICTKCFTKMYIPNEHFFNVPVVLLSPNLLSSPSLLSQPSSSSSYHQQTGVLDRLRSLNSAPNSPKAKRIVSSSSVTQKNSHMYSSMLNLHENRLNIRAFLNLYKQKTQDQINEIEMIVCQDCKTMVIQIIKSSRINRTTIRNNVIRNLTLNLSPVY